MKKNRNNEIMRHAKTINIDLFQTFVNLKKTREL